MPILAVDQNGNLYQTSGDRADNLGFGSYPDAVSQTDVTLGAAYLKAQARRTAENLSRSRAQAIQDHRDRVAKHLSGLREQAARKKAEVAATIGRHPAVIDRLTRQAHMMGHCDGMCNAMNGNTLSSNGQRGWAGMSRDQKIIHHELSGMGHDVTGAPDVSDTNRRAMMKLVDNVLRRTSKPVSR